MAAPVEMTITLDVDNAVRDLLAAVDDFLATGGVGGAPLPAPEMVAPWQGAGTVAVPLRSLARLREAVAVARALVADLEIAGVLPLPPNVITRRVALPGFVGTVFEAGDVLDIDAWNPTILDWLRDVQALPAEDGSMRLTHDQCVPLAPFEMLHSDDCADPWIWKP